MDELQAMDKVHKALEPLDDEARERVILWALSKLNLKSQKPIVDSHEGTDTINDIKKFIASKKPITKYQQLACIGFFLEKNEKVTEYGSKELEQANRNAKYGKITNIPQYFKDATDKYGFFMSTTGGKKSLTDRGENIVKLLPEQEKVKQYLQNNPIKSNRKKSKKSKNRK